MISDLSDNGQIQVVMDVGPETTNPLTSDHRLSINKHWQQGKYVRIPLQEMEDQVRYKMSEQAPPIFLFPDETGIVVKKKKGGCPFGYGADKKPEDVKNPFTIGFPVNQDKAADVPPEQKVESTDL